MKDIKWRKSYRTLTGNKRHKMNRLLQLDCLSKITQKNPPLLRNTTLLFAKCHKFVIIKFPFEKNCDKYFINIQLSTEKIHTCCKAFMSNFWLSIWEKNSSTDLLKLSNMLWGLFSNCLNSIGWNSSYLQYIESQSPDSQIHFYNCTNYPCKKGGNFTSWH